jgi:hypothetical protein
MNSPTEPSAKAPQAPAHPADSPQLAAQRLDASRLRLMAVLGQDRAKVSAGNCVGQSANQTADQSAPAPAIATLLAWLQQLPGAAVLQSAVESWWAQHPLRTVGVVGANAAQAALAPVAQRHPFALVAVAAVVGGVLGATKAWRWLPKSALLAGLVPQLLTQTLTHIPLQSWRSAFTWLSRDAGSQKVQRPDKST